MGKVYRGPVLYDAKELLTPPMEEEQPLSASNQSQEEETQPQEEETQPQEEENQPQEEENQAEVEEPHQLDTCEALWCSFPQGHAGVCNNALRPQDHQQCPHSRWCTRTEKHRGRCNQKNKRRGARGGRMVQTPPPVAGSRRVRSSEPGPSSQPEQKKRVIESQYVRDATTRGVDALLAYLVNQRIKEHIGI